MSEGAEECQSSAESVVFGGGAWHPDVRREELHGAPNASGVGFGHIYRVTTIMFRSRTDIPAIDTMGCPGAGLVWCSRQHNFCAEGGKGGAIKIERAVEVFLC